MGPRVVVVFAETAGAGAAPNPAVGVVPFEEDGRRMLTIVVKLGFTLKDAEGGSLVVAEPTACKLSGDQPSRFDATVPAELDQASDFVPRKGATDLLVVGHAHARAPTMSIQGSFRVTSGDGTPIHGAHFLIESGAAAAKIPLSAPYFRPLAGGVPRTAAVGSDDRFVRGVVDGVEPSVWNVATEALRSELGRVEATSVLELVGLLPPADGDVPIRGSVVSARRVVLPGVAPQVLVEGSTLDREPVALTLDTLWLDTDACTGALVWRGTVGPVRSYVDVHRLFVTVERFLAERPTTEWLSDTQRGVIQYAHTEQDVAEGRDPPAQDARLEAERYATWGETAPEPRISIEAYAEVSAELAEWPDRRSETLSRHSLTEDRWAIEERAWLERFAADSVSGSAALPTLFGEHFVRAQDRLARPEEESYTLRDYAGLRVEMERGADVGTILGEAKLTLAQWLRLERRWLGRAEASPAVARELEELVAELESELPDDDGDDDDDDDDG